MPDIEGLGDAATGAVIARAVEPAAGEGDGHTHELRCLNCGCTLAGDYCHCCGQKAHVHRTLGAFFHDLAHGLLHFEGKIFRTLPMLAAKPGALTRRYIDGERARFVSPIALFLFSIFVMFAVVSWAGGAQDWNVSSTIEAGLKDEREKLARLEAKRAKASAAQAPGLDRRIAETRADLAQLEALKDQGITRASFAGTERVEGDALFQAAYRKAKENPELLIYKLKTNAYKFSWALIPLSVPFVWLLFPFSRRFGLYDHTVFVTYSLSFMTLLVVAAVALGAVGLGTLAGFAILVPPLHMYLQLKGAYRLSRWAAAWRTVALGILSFVAVGLFSALLLLLGVLD